MNDHHRSGGLDPSAAEHLLDTAARAAAGRPPTGDTPHGAPADDLAHLREVLAAAAAPARPEELSGEDAAVAAFAAARSPHPTRWGAMAGRIGAHLRRLAVLPRIVTVKVLVGAAILVASGGVAVAAGTGHFPGQDPTPAPTHRSPKVPIERSSRPPAPGGPTAPTPRRPASPTPSPSAKAQQKKGTGKQPGNKGHSSNKPKKNPGTAHDKGQGKGDGEGNGKGRGKGKGKGKGKGHGRGHGNGNGHGSGGKGNGHGKGHGHEKGNGHGKGNGDRNGNGSTPPGHALAA